MKITNEKYKSLNLANQEERVENLIIDFIISSIFALFVTFLTFENITFAIIIYFLARFAYYFGFEFLFGRTPGKYQTRTKVVNENGNTPTVVQLIKRNLSRFISLVSGVSDDERALHDKLSNTFVIKNSELRKLEFRQPLILIFNLSFISYWIYFFWTKSELKTSEVILLSALILTFAFGLVLGIKKSTPR